MNEQKVTIPVVFLEKRIFFPYTSLHNDFKYMRPFCVGHKLTKVFVNILTITINCAKYNYSLILIFFYVDESHVICCGFFFRSFSGE